MIGKMVAMQLIESPNIIWLQTEINNLESDLIDIKTSPQKDSVAPPAKYAAMIIY
jgi:hypothetical protein